VYILLPHYLSRLNNGKTGIVLTSTEKALKKCTIDGWSSLYYITYYYYYRRAIVFFVTRLGCGGAARRCQQQYGGYANIWYMRVPLFSRCGGGGGAFAANCANRYIYHELLSDCQGQSELGVRLVAAGTRPRRRQILLWISPATWRESPDVMTRFEELTHQVKECCASKKRS
jgi:hypothetical protein